MRSLFLRGALLAMCGVCGVCAYGYFATQQQQAPTAQALHAATASPREWRADSDSALELQIAMHGMEPNKAGFHLLRPVSDPDWSIDFGNSIPHFNYRWWNVPVRYEDVEYQRLIPTTIVPGFITPLNALVSQRRTISNSLGSASVVPGAGGTFEVHFHFTVRGVTGLQALLEPTTTFPDTFEYSDWYVTTLPNGSPATLMTVAVVCDDKAYLPFVIQDVIASAGTGGATVVVADKLGTTEAAALAAKLNVVN